MQHSGSVGSLIVLVAVRNVADMLDAVASFQQVDDTMTDAEARALADTANKYRPKIQEKSLQSRP